MKGYKVVYKDDSGEYKSFHSFFGDYGKYTCRYKINEKTLAPNNTMLFFFNEMKDAQSFVIQQTDGIKDRMNFNDTHKPDVNNIRIFECRTTYAIRLAYSLFNSVKHEYLVEKFWKDYKRLSFPTDIYPLSWMPTSSGTFGAKSITLLKEIETC